MVPRSAKSSAVPSPRALAKRKATPHGLRIAAIDLGSNSLHMVVVEVTEQLGFRILGSEKELVQLGREALVQHRLSARGITLTLEALNRFQQIARRLECDTILCYATSAVRECVNGGDFVDQVKQKLGLVIQVISAQEEARLIYLAVRQAVDLDEEPALIIDIGGGSAEFIVGTARKPLMLESVKLGSSRLTQMFIHSDPIGGKDLSQLQKHIRKTLKPIFKQLRKYECRRFIGTSGTMENLAAMCHEQHGEEAQQHRLLTRMDRDDFEAVAARLQELPVAKRRQLPGLDPGRAEQIVAGAVLVGTLFERLDIASIEVCDRAMREGMIIDFMQTHWPKVRLSVQIKDPRRRSVVELGRRCNYNERHAEEVAKIALSLFDQLRSLHRLDAASRELLEYAAMLHDIGWHIGHVGHHKHSYYLIKNGDLTGFSPLELELIATIARYHRRSMPKKSHEAYMSLSPADRERVKKLAAILRIADGLDRGHYGNVEKIRVLRRGKTVRFHLEARSDPELELWAGEKKAEMFTAVFGRRAEFSARKPR